MSMTMIRIGRKAQKGIPITPSELQEWAEFAIKNPFMFKPFKKLV